MEIIVSARHFDLTEEIRTYLEGKLENLFENKESLKVSTIRVILTLEKKSRFKAEIVVNMKSCEMEAADETYDLLESIDNAVEKLNKQVKKRLDRLQDHQHMPMREVTRTDEFEVIKDIEEV